MNRDDGVTRQITERMPTPPRAVPGRKAAEKEPPSAVPSTPTTAFTPTTVFASTAAPCTAPTEQVTQPLISQQQLTQPLIPKERLTPPAPRTEQLTQRLIPSTPRTEQLTQRLVPSTPRTEQLTQQLIPQERLTQRLIAPDESAKPVITEDESVKPVIVQDGRAQPVTAQDERANRVTVQADPVTAQRARVVAQNEPGTRVIAQDDTGTRVAARLEQLTAAVEAEVKKETPVEASPCPPPAGAPSVSSASSAGSRQENLEPYLRQSLERLAKKTPPDSATQMPIVAKKPLEQPVDGIPQRQSRPAPEDRKTFTEIRELARDSARSDLAEVTHLALVVHIRATFLAATAASLLSSTMALAYLLTHFRAALGGATLLFAIAIVLACRFFVLRRRLAK